MNASRQGHLQDASQFSYPELLAYLGIPVLLDSWWAIVLGVIMVS